MECFLGQILLWPMNWAPINFAICNGQKLQIMQYQALYSLLGVTYGGDGTTYFCLPDLRGRAPIAFGQGTGLGNYQFGQPYGKESVQLSVANLAKHTHTGSVSLTGSAAMRASLDDATSSVPYATAVLGKTNSTGMDDLSNPAVDKIYRDATNMIDLPNALALDIVGGGTFETDATGDGTAFGILSPVLAMNYVICIQGGLYPQKND